MSEQPQIYVSCSTHPILSESKSIKLSHRHEYAPPAVEAYIILNHKRSTKSLRKRFSALFSFSQEFREDIEKFLASREKLLEMLSKTPEVVSFLNYVLKLEAEVETELEMETEEKMLEKMLMGEVEETKEGIEIIHGYKGREYDNLLDAISDAIKQERKCLGGKSALEVVIRNYIQNFLDLINRLIEQRLQIKKYGISSQQLQRLIAEIIACDVMFIADEEEQLQTEKSLLIPLDISPLRILLAIQLIEKLSVNAKNWNRMFCPPILLMWKDNIPRLVKPYRTLDKHPIMIRVPAFDRDPERFQVEVGRVQRDFLEYINPLIGKLKGLTPFGKRGTHPGLIKKHLSRAISLYMDYNPFCVENFRVIDLGCGSGALLKDVYQRLFEERSDLFGQIFIYTLLNDIIKDPGKSLRVESQKEDFVNRLEIDIYEGDLRELIETISEKKERFDMAFINRVLDIYGGYGIFMFEKKDVEIQNSSFPTVQTQEITPIELDDKVIAFSGFAAFTNLWRAIKFLMGQSVDSMGDIVFLPAVYMNALSNFFSWKGRKGLDLLKKLLDMAELVFISVFPGSFETLFPLDNSHTNEILKFDVIEPNTYSIICISRNKSLIEHLASKWQRNS